MDFDLAVAHVLKDEGGYVNDPNDRGGETKYGISKRAYPSVDIKNLTKSEAADIYFKDYWIPSNSHLLPPEIRLIHFSTAVNAGVGSAAKILQSAAHVKVDGAIGPITLKAAKNVSNDLYCVYLLDKYIDIVVKDHSQIKYLNGWRNRAIRMT